MHASKCAQAKPLQTQPVKRTQPLPIEEKARACLERGSGPKPAYRHCNFEMLSACGLDEPSSVPLLFSPPFMGLWELSIVHAYLEHKILSFRVVVLCSSAKRASRVWDSVWHSDWAGLRIRLWSWHCQGCLLCQLCDCMRDAAHDGRRLLCGWPYSIPAKVQVQSGESSLLEY